MPRRRPPLSPEERALWEKIAAEVKPLKGRGEKPAPVPPPEPAALPPETTAPKPRKRTAAKPPPASPPPPSPGVGGAGLDRRNALRLRRGQLPLEAKLDLHGMTQARAHAALRRFVEDAAADGLRVVIVVTGKGRTQEQGGVLRREVPRWLAEPALARHVVSIAPARPQHGGEGALYLYLRRKRME